MMSNPFKDAFEHAWAYLIGNLKVDGDDDLRDISLKLQLLFHNSLSDSTNSPAKTKELEQLWMDSSMFVSFQFPHKLTTRYIDDTIGEYKMYLTTTSKNIILRGSNGMIMFWSDVHPVTQQELLQSIIHAKKPEHYPADLYYFFKELF